MAVLTAIMQVTARATGLPLDKMAVDTHVTTMMSAEEAKDYPENGLFVHGLFMEGARWAVGEEAGESLVVGNTPTAGFITESRLKQLLPPMPLLYLRAVPVQPKWLPTGVGFMRMDPSIYEAPVYVTTFRGHTYVFLATLKTFKPSVRLETVPRCRDALPLTHAPRSSLRRSPPAPAGNLDLGGLRARFAGGYVSDIVKARGARRTRSLAARQLDTSTRTPPVCGMGLRSAEAFSSSSPTPFPATARTVMFIDEQLILSRTGGGRVPCGGGR